MRGDETGDGDETGTRGVKPGRGGVKPAGSPQGLLPGAPTDPSMHVKCTRFVTLWSIAVPRTSGSFRGDTLVRRGVLSVVPTCHPQRGAPFADWVRRAVPQLQCYYGALRLLAVHLAALRLLRLAIPPFRPSFVPVGLGRGPRISPELVSRVSDRQSRWRRQGLPSSRETRAIIRHVPPTPV